MVTSVALYYTTTMRHLLLGSLLLVAGISWAQPANDNPCSATALTVGASCSFSTYTNAAATASAGVPAPGCASYSGGDVWFTALVPANGQVIIDMNTGVITDSGLALYTGTCGSLTLLSCDDDASSNGAMSYLAASGLTPGSTLFIRVWEYGNNNNGSVFGYQPYRWRYVFLHGRKYSGFNQYGWRSCSGMCQLFRSGCMV